MSGFFDAVAGVIGNHMNNLSAERAQQRQSYYNLIDMNNQYVFEQMAWDKQNAYNSPKAQMERYREAGLNPNLIYQQSNEAGASPISVSGGAGSFMSQSQFTLPDLVDMYTRLQQFDLSKQKMEEDIEAQKLDNNNRAVENGIKQLTLNKELENSKYYGVNAKYQSDEWKAKVDKANKDLADMIFKLEHLNPIKEKQEQEILNGYILQNDLRRYEKEEAKFRKGNFKFLNDAIETLRNKFPKLFSGEPTHEEAEKLFNIWHKINNPLAGFFELFTGNASLPNF